MTEPAAARCPFCEKKGLPILPLRYAVARTDYDDKRPSWKALDLPSGFGAGVTDIALPAQSARYTARLLRPGYLYVFNEVRGEWKAYLVTELGYLYEFDIDTTTPPDADEIEFACFRTGEEHIARCITIPDAANAGRVWLGFSDTAWTADVLAKHREHAYRERHMRVIDVKQWASGNTGQPHTAEFTQLQAVVNEFAKTGIERGGEQAPVTMGYATDPETGESIQVINLPNVDVQSYPAFDFSPHRFNGFKHEAPGLLEWAAQAAEPHAPMLVALDDPVGITAELAALMDSLLGEFLSQEKIERPLAISALVDSLQEAIRNQAELDKVKSVHAEAVKRIEPGYGLLARDGGLDLRQHHKLRLKESAEYRRNWDKRVADAEQAAADTLNADDLDKAAEDAWKKYSRKLQEGEPDNWKQTAYQPLLDEFDQKHMVCLAEAHQAWLQSETMVNAFDCNHDEADAESGACFVQTLLLCIQDTQQNKICFDNYQAWLEANTSDPANLLQRALAYNQKAVLDAMDGAVSGSGIPASQLPSVPWGKLIGLYDKSLKHLDKGGHNLVAQLVTAVGGPIMKVLDNGIDKTLGRTVIYLGIIGKAPIEVVRHTGTVSSALEIMVNMMKELNPEALGDVDAGLLQKRLEIRSRGKRLTQQERGADGRFGASKVTLRVDRFALKQIGSDLTPEQAADRAGRAALKMDDWPKNQMARFKTMFGTNARLAVVGLILQVVGAKKMAEGLDDSMAHKRVENSWRYHTSLGAIVSGVGNILHDGIVSGAKAGSMRLGKAANSLWTKILGIGAKALGFAAAGIMAVLDGVNVVKEALKGNYGVAGLYFLSAGVGLGAALLLGGAFGTTITVFGAVLSATGVGLVLVVIGIAIALLIDFLKSNELQDWLERSRFGALASERYGDLDEEMKQFGLAMKALGIETTERKDDTVDGLVPQAR